MEGSNAKQRKEPCIARTAGRHGHAIWPDDYVAGIRIHLVRRDVDKDDIETISIRGVQDIASRIAVEGIVTTAGNEGVLTSAAV